jgi:calcineurin-like phosphoesterase family protein
VVTGELDFFINGSLKWALELLRNGKKNGERMERFDETVGKYRVVEMNDYLVVDCKTPQPGQMTDR